MATLTIDTLHFVKQLRQSGMPEQQAEAIAVAFQEVTKDAELATKQDIEILRMEFRKDMAELKSDLIRWVVGAGFLQTALIAALLLKMIK